MESPQKETNFPPHVEGNRHDKGKSGTSTYIIIPCEQHTLKGQLTRACNYLGTTLSFSTGGSEPRHETLAESCN